MSKPKEKKPLTKEELMKIMLAVAELKSKLRRKRVEAYHIQDDEVIQHIEVNETNKDLPN